MRETENEQQLMDDAPLEEDLYLDLLKRTLTRYLFAEAYQPLGPMKPLLARALFAPLRQLLSALGMEIVRKYDFDHRKRAEGRDWPSEAETMIGLKRLDNLQYCITEVLRQSVPGDLIETGVWRGGAAIFMKAVLKARGDESRRVWVADSFEGLPKPDGERYPADRGDRHWTWSRLSVSLDEVKQNFARYGLLDQRVRFLAGWFRDTLPSAPIQQLAVLRLDGDMYESTLDALRHLHPKLSIGGFVIVDDYGAVPGCRAAVEDYRLEHDITEPIISIDWSGVYWQRKK